MGYFFSTSLNLLRRLLLDGHYTIFTEKPVLKKNGFGGITV